ncbi:alpha/beta fold hydrolase [Comamonas testosteroni]|uniref:alpha/beta fold hydrolase n=1 Tax=Comamonas testosteroni TaxID=285 RepID=UPI00265DF135|nr:alpha/beta fold hydrolase [Comamonas testosteroni]WKL15884.1 alpha/beta fold hydrolase [Comamonas testosteroni]
MTNTTTETSRRLVRYLPPKSNTEVHIEYADQGTGRIICILPSLARSGRDYDVVAHHLQQDGFRVIRPEPRGIGNSHGPMQGLSLHDFAADVAAVLDQERTGPILIVGHAWGSQPARMLAADRPDLVCGVIMAAASAGKLPPESSEMPYSRLRDAIDGASDFSLSEEQRLDCLRRAFFAPGHDPRVWLDGWNTEAHEAQSHARRSTPVDDYFTAGTQVPILDLQAEHDAVVIPKVMKLYLGERVTEQVISDAGHAMAPEQPRAMADAIAAFAHRIYQK